MTRREAKRIACHAVWQSVEAGLSSWECFDQYPAADQKKISEALEELAQEMYCRATGKNKKEADNAKE